LFFTRFFFWGGLFDPPAHFPSFAFLDYSFAPFLFRRSRSAVGSPEPFLLLYLKNARAIPLKSLSSLFVVDFFPFFSLVFCFIRWSYSYGFLSTARFRFFFVL